MKESRKWMNRLIQSIVILIIAFLTGIITYHVSVLDELFIIKNKHSQLNKESQRLYKLTLLHQFDETLYDDIELIHNQIYNTVFSIKNNDYQLYLNELTHLNEKWEELKQSIVSYRSDNSKITQFLVYSEHYYDYTTTLENTFDNYFHSIILSIRQFVYGLVFFVVVLVIFYGYLLFTKMKLAHHNDELEVMSFIDEATNLPNRRKCNEMIQRSFEYSKYLLYGCVMFDLNNLKYVNDHYGHQYGDLLIHHFSSILKNKMNEDVFIGRYGGDEFIMLTRNYNEIELGSIVDDIQKEVDQFNQSHTQVSIQFAWGYAFSSKEIDRSMEELIELADMDMYRCKRNMKKEIIL